MMQWVGKKIFGALLGVILCTAIFNPFTVAAAEQCCAYTVNLDVGINPPSWLVKMGDSATFLKSAGSSGTCAKPQLTIPVSVFGQYFEENILSGACSATSEAKTMQAALAKVQCCILSDVDGKTVACKDKPATDVTNNCFAVLQTTGKLNSVAQQITNGAVPCAQLDTCKAPAKPAGAATGVPIVTVPGTTQKKVWTKQECEGVKAKDGEPAYNWLPPKKDPTAQSGNYCYIKPIRTNLQIHIGESYLIDGINNYINIAYKYALGLGIIIMILTIMVSGIQWMTSGIASSINDAKQRIQNGALGLLLLFGANVLLNTINPQLTQLQLPLMNAIRPESFDVVQKTDAKRCDPGKADSCSQYGTQYKCKPTEYYASNKCVAQFRTLMAVTFGGAALAAAGPFLIPAGGVASVTQTAGSSVLREVASTAVQEGVEVAVNATTKSEAGTAGGAVVDVATAGGTSKFGKAAKIGKGVFAVAGAVLAADYIIENWPEDANSPADGYCIIPKPDKPSFSVCEFDGECQSGKCLLTSKGACGAGNYGVCTSGAVREACVIPKNYSLGLIDALGNKAEADKYKCNGGAKCVDNGRGATKAGVGICSDGSDIGLPCSDEMKCSSLKNKLECVRGFCREAGYFGTSGKINGMIIDYDDMHPRCMLPTDCTDNLSGPEMAHFQSTGIAGCLKGPSTALNLPGRFLLPQLNAKVDKSFYSELTTYGLCVTDKPYFKRYKDKTDYKSGESIAGPIAQRCYVNIYPTKQFDPHVEKIASYLKAQGFEPAGKFATFDIKKVGCGKEGNVVNGACLIKPSDVKGFSGDFANNTFMSIRGECADELSASAKTAIVKHKQSGEEMIGVGESDKFYSGLRIPNIIDLQYTYAGVAE